MFVGFSISVGLSHSTTVFADRYWDLTEPRARAVAATINPGDILLTFCPSCDGAYHIMVVDEAPIEHQLGWTRCVSTVDFTNTLTHRTWNKSFRWQISIGSQWLWDRRVILSKKHGRSNWRSQWIIDYTYTYRYGGDQFIWLGHDVPNPNLNNSLTLSDDDLKTVYNCFNH